MVFTLLNEGRQPVTPVDGAGCGACGCAFVTHVPGTLRVGRPLTGTTRGPQVARWTTWHWSNAGTKTRCGISGWARLMPATSPEERLRECESSTRMMRREASRVFATTCGVSGMPCVFTAHHSPHSSSHIRARPRRHNNRAVLGTPVAPGCVPPRSTSRPAISRGMRG